MTTRKVAIQTKYAENAETTQYTATSVDAELDKFTATNVTGSNATIAVSIVPSGSAAGTGNRITSTKTIAPGKTYTFPELIGHILKPGDFISTLAGTATAIVIRGALREYS